MPSTIEADVTSESLEGAKTSVESDDTSKREKTGWCVDWTGARKEFSWEKLWTERLWSDIAGNFAKVFLLSLIPTLFDVAL